VDVVVMKNFNSFLTILSKSKGFPYSKQELIDLIDKYQFLKVEDSNVHILANDMYQTISTFFNQIQNFINMK
jgi:hypothetical protein